MKIWLDDIRSKPSKFDVHVKTAGEAIALLETGKVTDISLDHDLGESENGTGYDVAKWIESRAYRWMNNEEGGIGPVFWSVHSQNPIGKKNMAQALFKAETYWASRTPL